MFTGWGPDATALLAEISHHNTRAFLAEHRARYDAQVRGPSLAIAAELAGEFGPVRVFRRHVDTRFRPDAPPLRTDTGGVARTVGGSELGVVLTASALTVTAGHHRFDGGQLRRWRAAVAAGSIVPADPPSLPGWERVGAPDLTGRPRGIGADHPRLGLLRRRGLLLARSWPVGPWLATPEPLARVREAWHAAAPLTAWLDEHVGAAEPRQRVAVPAS